MALIEEMNKQGNFLFRWRSYVPGVILLFFAFYIPQSKYLNHNYLHHLYYGGLCLAVSLFGMWIRLMVIGYAPARTSGRNTKEQVADVVNMTGIYSIMRHPLYVGNYFMFLGIVMFVMDLSFVFLFTFFCMLYYERIMFAEEMFLRNKFGKTYLAWADVTPAIIPSFKNYVKPERPFSIRNCIKREYHGFFGLVFFFTLVDICMIYFNEPVARSHSFLNIWRPIHIYFFGGGLTIYILIRLLVKATKLFYVPGR